MSRPRLEIDPTILDNLPREGHSRHWRELLLANGLLVDLGSPREDDSAPVQTLRAIQGLHARLSPMEDLRTQLAHRIAWNVGGVPRQVWLGMGVFFFVVLAVSNLLVAMCGSPVLLAPLALTGLAVAGVLELNRQTELGEAEQVLEQDRTELAQLVRELLTRDYLARFADRTAIVLPSVQWLTQRAAEVRRLHTARPTPELGDLLADLEADTQRLRAAAEALYAEDPEFSQEGLEVDLSALADRLAALELAPDTQPRFAAALIASRRPSGDSPTSA